MVRRRIEKEEDFFEGPMEFFRQFGEILSERGRFLRAGRRPDWEECLAAIRRERSFAPDSAVDPWPAGREIIYVLDIPASIQEDCLLVRVTVRDRKKSGEWGDLKVTRESAEVIVRLPDPLDRQVLCALQGSVGEDSPYQWRPGYSEARQLLGPFRLNLPLSLIVLPWMAQTGRLWMRTRGGELVEEPLVWDAGPPYVFFLEMKPLAKGRGHELTGSLRRGEERLPITAPELVACGKLLVARKRIALMDDRGAGPWINLFRKTESEMEVGAGIVIPPHQGEKFIAELIQDTDLPPLDFPEELRIREVPPAPPLIELRVQPVDRFLPNRARKRPPEVKGELAFHYGETRIPGGTSGNGFFRPATRERVMRDTEAERRAQLRLLEAGFHWVHNYNRRAQEFVLPAAKLPPLASALVAEGWRLEAEGKLYRQCGRFNFDVTSGIDWFDLRAEVEFEGQRAAVPALLAALERGEGWVPLEDGSLGILPKEWLAKYAGIAGLGTVEGERLRFRRSQAGFLDALLASQPGSNGDETFERAREALRSFEGISPVDPPASFAGELRPYQREGLGWLEFLERFGFGGCLADDMGLGKTVQVLAFLDSRLDARRRRSEGEAPLSGGSLSAGAGGSGPSLVVVPRSLVFNWKAEAKRFAPRLRILDHSAPSRPRETEHFRDHDVVLTTYGVLVRDAAILSGYEFDCVILDEAQAIKNAGTESAKAARLLRGARRLALSGTPVENHLGELWSLFEFLNPGMLGRSQAFATGASLRNPSGETLPVLAQALRPFILRRTKDQVAPDLPPRQEQVLYCELEGDQRRLYDELRDHYRRSLLPQVDAQGLGSTRIQVLEALLRLRQAALHPGLIDRQRAADPSAKLDLLSSRLEEAVEEGRKVLVFSQFTTMLGIVRDRLTKARLAHEYLDGRTRDRAVHVERFQSDPELRIFLISLKAGGLGLNLTAADTVFILDPWWNPAVEAQAVDRAHRIGQTKPVFAYRLIARGTVEEKVLELQEKKRSLAEAVITADNRLIGNLQREDLELLLS